MRFGIFVIVQKSDPNHKAQDLQIKSFATAAHKWEYSYVLISPSPISEQGGLSSLEKRAKDYTYGHESVKHELLYNAAFKAYLESVSVSKDESSALTYAFIQKLKNLR